MSEFTLNNESEEQDVDTEQIRSVFHTTIRRLMELALSPSNNLSPENRDRLMRAMSEQADISMRELEGLLPTPDNPNSSAFDSLDEPTTEEHPNPYESSFK